MAVLECIVFFCTASPINKDMFQARLLKETYGVLTVRFYELRHGVAVGQQVTNGSQGSTNKVLPGNKLQSEAQLSSNTWVVDEAQERGKREPEDDRGSPRRQVTRPC